MRSGGHHDASARRGIGAGRRDHERRQAPAAAYEGLFLLPRDVHGFRPRVWRLFDLLENTARRCPAGCIKYLPIAALMVHLNDDHQWTRERIAEWVRGELRVNS